MRKSTCDHDMFLHNMEDNNSMQFMQQYSCKSLEYGDQLQGFKLILDHLDPLWPKI